MGRIRSFSSFEKELLLCCFASPPRMEGGASHTATNYDKWDALDLSDDEDNRVGEHAFVLHEAEPVLNHKRQADVDHRTT